MEEQGASTIPRTSNSTNIPSNNYTYDINNNKIIDVNPQKSMQISKWVSDLNWHLILLLFLSFFLFLFYISSYGGTLELNFYTTPKVPIIKVPNNYYYNSSGESTRKDELTRSRIAVCLVGGARRFELTGPSIIERVLNEFPNSDLFLNSPLDSNSFKFSLLKFANRVNSVRVFKPTRIPETLSQIQVLTSANSPSGIQGLLQYFNLVEGCLTMIESYQRENGFTYDWIVRTRVDGYWSAPLDSRSFIRGQYVVPPGSTFGGLNDRFGIGDYKTSIVALSRLSLIPTLRDFNYTGLNSEAAFKAQLVTYNVTYRAQAQPFCIVSDRKYGYPPTRSGVPVAAISSHGPLSGLKCRPCKPPCVGQCVADVMLGLSHGWSWAPWRNGTLELCDARDKWELGWENIFDEAVGENLAQFRKYIGLVNVAQCVEDFKQIKGRAAKWDTPPLEEICKLGLEPKP